MCVHVVGCWLFLCRGGCTQVRGWRRILVITSAYHMPRTRAIFDWVFALPVLPGTSAPGPASASAAYELVYVEASDEHLPKDMVAARTDREQQSLRKVEALAATLRSVSALHAWLSTSHDLYAPARFLTSEREKANNAALRKSYGN
jgi:hypothetical protein